MSCDSSGFEFENSFLMLMYEVIREPDILREVSQLQSCEVSGGAEMAIVNVWVAAPHEQATVNPLTPMSVA